MTFGSADREKPNKFECFDSTRHIVFQFPIDLNNHLHSRYTTHWSNWSSLLEPIISAATDCYGYSGGRTARIMLADVRPGGRIGRHIDDMGSADTPHKIHVPIRTHPKVRFFEASAAYHLQRGVAYEVNNKIMHGVENQSDADRAHLIFDYFDPL